MFPWNYGSPLQVTLGTVYLVTHNLLSFHHQMLMFAMCVIVLIFIVSKNIKTSHLSQLCIANLFLFQCCVTLSYQLLTL